MPATAATAAEKSEVTRFPPAVEVTVAVIFQPAVTPSPAENLTVPLNEVPLVTVIRPRYTCPWLPVVVAGEA